MPMPPEDATGVPQDSLDDKQQDSLRIQYHEETRETRGSKVIGVGGWRQ